MRMVGLGVGWVGIVGLGVVLGEDGRVGVVVVGWGWWVGSSCWVGEMVELGVVVGWGW